MDALAAPPCRKQQQVAASNIHAGISSTAFLSSSATAQINTIAPARFRSP